MGEANDRCIKQKSPFLSYTDQRIVGGITTTTNPEFFILPNSGINCPKIIIDTINNELITEEPLDSTKNIFICNSDLYDPDPCILEVDKYIRVADINVITNSVLCSRYKLTLTDVPTTTTLSPTTTTTSSPTTTTSSPTTTTTTTTSIPNPIYPGNIISNNSIYTQSSVWSQNLAATALSMNNKIYNETSYTGTNSSSFEWIKVDLGSIYSVKNIVIGCDLNGTLLTGWGKSYTENCTIQYSIDNTNWINTTNTGTFSTPFKVFPVNINARYIRITRSGYLAVTEFAVGT